MVLGKVEIDVAPIFIFKLAFIAASPKVVMLYAKELTFPALKPAVVNSAAV